jgi:putative ABC transport system permease protein
MFQLALRNLTRHRLRTSVTLGAIAVGVAGLIVSGGFVRDIYVQLAEASIHSQTGHLQIAKRGFFTAADASPERWRLTDAARYARTVAALPGVRQVMVRVDFRGLLGNGRVDRPIIGEGVEPAKEAALGSYLRLITGRALGDGDTFGMMVGEGLARALKLAPGDRVTLLVNTAEGALNSLDFDVVGVFQTFSRDFDARAVRIHAQAAQELLLTSGVNVIVIELERTADTARIAKELRRRFANDGLDVRTWRELNDFYEKTVLLYDRQFGIVLTIVFAMVVLGVANSVNMAAFERVGEFGTMRALGNSRRDVFRLVVMEGALLGVVAAGIGLLLGMAIALLLSAIGIPMPPPPNANIGYRAMIRIAPDVLGSAFVAGFVGAALASVVPALRVSRMRIVDALRANV